MTIFKCLGPNNPALFDYIIIYCSSQLLSTLIVDELNVWLLYII